MAKRLTEGFVKLEVEKRGYILISKFINTRTKIVVICKNGHKWKTMFGRIIRDVGCSFCAGNTRHTTEYVGEHIRSLGGILISDYKNNESKIKIQCICCNKEWTTRYRNVVDGRWCPNCARIKSIKNTFVAVSDFVNKMGGQLITQEMEFNHGKSKIMIVCKKCGTIWNPRIDAIMCSGQWCPKCSSKYRKRQIALSLIIKDIFFDKIVIDNCRSIEWLRNPDSGYPLEMDIFVPSIGLAIEYDGEQHYRPICFGGICDADSIIRFEITKKHDVIKNKLMAEHKNEIRFFMRVKYDEPITMEYIENRLHKIGALQ